MADYPDYTDVMQIIGSDIMVPMDIQASYIMMPVDLQAQYITLEIDIAAQSIGNIAIDIAAQSIGNIGIDIAAQTIGNLVIDIEAQSLGIYLQGEWVAKEGDDKNLYGTQANVASGSVGYPISYSVPSGKTLIISHFGFSNISNSGNMEGGIYDYTDNEWFAVTGGAQGSSMVFNKPIAIPGGHTVKIGCIQFSGSASTVRAHIGGYEL